MPTLRRRWPDPDTGHIIDQSRFLGAGGGSPRASGLRGVSVGQMDEQPSRKNLSGWTDYSNGRKKAHND